MIDFRNVFMYSDHPTGCPRCGARTEIILDLSHTKEMTQIHECIGTDCRFMFVMQIEETLLT